MIESPGELLRVINTSATELNISRFSYQDLFYFSNIADPSRYKTFQIPKKHKDSDGLVQYRTIYAPTKRLCQFLMIANQWLASSVALDEHAYGFVKGRSIVDNARRHVKKNYLFSVDLSDFFPSTSFHLVAASFKRNFPNLLSESVMRTLINASCVNIDASVCLAQGSPLSPLLSNIACIDMDKQIAHMANHSNVTYSRYADDMSFSSDNNVFYDDFCTSLSNIVNSYGYNFNNRKTRLSRKGNRHIVTGIVVNEKANVTRDYIKDIRNILYIWGKYGYARASHRFQKKHHYRYEYAPRLELYVSGRIAFLKQVKGDQSPLYLNFLSRYKTLINDLISQSKEYTGKGIPYGSFREALSIERFYGVSFYVNGHNSIDSDDKGNYYIWLGDYEKVLVSPKIMKFWKSLPIKLDEREMGWYTLKYSRITMLPKGREYKWILSMSKHKLTAVIDNIIGNESWRGMAYFDKGEYASAAVHLEIAAALGDTLFYYYYVKACHVSGMEVKF